MNYPTRALWQLRNPAARHPMRRRLDNLKQLQRIDERQTMLDLRAKGENA